MIKVESAGLSDTGRKRKGNEDSFFLDEALGLYVVADGMGGHAAGEVASRLAAETVYNYMKNALTKDAASGNTAEIATGASLLAALELANQSVLQAAEAQKKYSGMGTTLSAVFFTENGFLVANVGDSPVYQIRTGADEMALVSQLHTFASEMAAENPGVTVSNKSFNHILTQAVGVREKIQPALAERSCAAGDVIVLCSDGLTDMVQTEEIQQVVRAHPPAEACQHLVDRANAAGGEDNITVIVLKIKKMGGGKRSWWEWLQAGWQRLTK